MTMFTPYAFALSAPSGRTCFGTPHQDDILAGCRIKQHFSSATTIQPKVPSVPRVLTHDQAIAQKENPGKKRRHHDRSRSEDEKILTIAEDLPAEVPLLPCTSLPVKNAVLKFPSPPRRKRRKTVNEDEGPANSRKSLDDIHTSIFVPASVEQSPGRDAVKTDFEASASSSQDAGSLFGAWLFKNSPESAARRPSLISAATSVEEEHVSNDLPSPKCKSTSISKHTTLDQEPTDDSAASTTESDTHSSLRFTMNNDEHSRCGTAGEGEPVAEIIADPPYSATVLRQSSFE